MQTSVALLGGASNIGDIGGNYVLRHRFPAIFQVRWRETEIFDLAVTPHIMG